MIPKVGDVYLLDVGCQGKVRPVVIMSREDTQAPRALSLFVPLTKNSHGTRYEVQMPSAMAEVAVASVQAIGVAEFAELRYRTGRFDSLTVDKIKGAIRWIFDL